MKLKTSKENKPNKISSKSTPLQRYSQTSQEPTTETRGSVDSPC